MTEPELWQLVERWRKDNHTWNQQLLHLKAINALQLKLYERKTTTSDHTGEARPAPRRDA